MRSLFLKSGRIALFFITLSSPGLAELKPGDVLDQSNWQEAKGLLPESVLKYFAQGQARAPIIEVKDEAYRLDQEFQRDTEANAGKYYIDERGALMEVATKTYPRWWKGLPFPEINPSDPTAGAQVIYNLQALRWHVDDLFWFVKLNWVGDAGLDRYVTIGTSQLNFVNRPSGPADNPDELNWKEVMFGVAPYDVVGVSTMTWYHQDPSKWQSIWSFVPVVRRIRRLTAANQSDGMFGSAAARNDPNVFIGNPAYFNWKLIGEQDLLAPITKPDGPAITMQSTAPNPSVIESRSATIRKIGWHEPYVKWGYNSPDWNGVPWWPTSFSLAKRRVWVIEGSPKDPYYAYGRWIGYFDKKTTIGYYKVIYDHAGEYWRTVINGELLPRAEDGSRVWKMVSGIVFRDDRQNVTNTMDVIGPNNGVNMFVEEGHNYANDQLMTGAMTRLGK